ncbi:hypothetical protein [Halomicrococcus gelatinilyticus]|uniref:hypothetical protein n=1 Tax=Halomicrococcus gelatinilyticus TaxID=1702103 RepID=UPI002E14C902
MSTRNSGGLDGPVADSAPEHLNRGLQLAGLFFFVNGIYLAFFSETLATTLGYYLVVVAASAAVVSRVREVGTRRPSHAGPGRNWTLPSIGDASMPSLTSGTLRRRSSGRSRAGAEPRLDGGTVLRRCSRLAHGTVERIVALVPAVDRSGRDRL